MIRYGELLGLLMPETILVVTVLLVLFTDLGLMHGQAHDRRRLMAAALSSLGCLLAVFSLSAMPPQQSLMDGMLVVGPLSQMVKQYLLLLTFSTIVITTESDFTSHIGEYFAMLLMATLGFMFMVSIENILMIFVSLELASLSLYILTGFARQRLASIEAALKYFFFGGMAAAFLLFGLSFIYGATGAANLPAIAAKAKTLGLNPLLMLGLAMVIVGLGFKIAVVPFQLWAPDVYQGAPIPSAALIASGSKVASFFLLAKVMMVGFDGLEGSGAWHQMQSGWAPLLAGLAAFSLILGNLAAIAQTSVRRLLAYSAIAHAGYMIVCLLADNQQGVTSLLYYVLTYALATVGAFGIVAVVTNQDEDDDLSRFAGLSQRSPVLALCLLVFLLSLAGIPPLAGFFGKFYMFAAALGAEPHKLGLLWLVSLAIAMSAVSLYYYLQVLKQAYVSQPDPDDAPLRVSIPTQVVICCLAIGVVLLGCLPNLLVGKLLAAIQSAGF